ncbi:hypothetical protein CCHOA_00645 [Corynebacterium choanae]|uniref:Uncharacterized protein n=1 Tax=Corynebacterium choanae TaxID=1862358 RepID=A0A3G6J6L3_9CORY|nr:hypothetical protein CCHOA_00645 [Corynebacterium choanae]
MVFGLQRRAWSALNHLPSLSRHPTRAGAGRGELGHFRRSFLEFEERSSDNERVIETSNGMVALDMQQAPKSK